MPGQDSLFRIFQGALRTAATDLDAYLELSCAGEEQREMVEALLQADAANRKAPPRLVAGGAPTLLVEDVLAGLLGSELSLGSLDSTSAQVRRLGAYQLQLELGRGGMGVVYLALQESTNQLVALKCLRAGISTSKMVLRFKQEIAVLGQLDHPGIAKVFDAGVANGEIVGGGSWELHYFAMEYVRGSNLSDFVRDRALDTRGRLTLIATICDAVHHAHTQGIVHRDLKPANILVTETGQPKVLDFGVSRVVDREHQLTTLDTSDGQLIGTLSYMSPEQAGGDQRAVDASSDVYALGVIAFEVLSGSLPHDLSEHTLLSGARAIRDSSPRRLATVTSSLAIDVQTIVGKALEREPQRRYHNAAELAEDLRRFLRHETIHARPPSVIYSMLKFTRRYRALVAGTLMLMLILVTATLFSSYASIEADAARLHAERSAYKVTLFSCETNLRMGLLGYVQDALAAVPESARNWEYRYLNRRADQSEMKMAGHHSFVIWCVAVSPDGRTGYSCGGGSNICAWDVATGECVQAIEHYDIEGEEREHVFSLAVSPDGGTLAVGAGYLSLLDAKTLKTRVVLATKPTSIHGLAYSPDGSLLASGDGKGIVRFWRVGDGLDNASISVELGHTGASVSELAFSPDGEILACACRDGRVWLWRIASGEELAVIEPPAKERALSIAFARDGKRLAIGYDDGRLWQVNWQTREGTSPPTPYTQAAHAGQLNEIAFTPDGRHLLTASDDKTIRVWDAETLEPVSQLVGHTGKVSSLCVDPGGQFILSAAWDLTLRLWDAPRALAGNLRYPIANVHRIMVGDEAGIFATLSDNNEVVVRRISSGQALREVPRPALPIEPIATRYPGADLARRLHVALDPPVNMVRGGRLFWQFVDSSLTIHDGGSAELLRKLNGVQSSVYAVAVDGERWIAAVDHELMLIRIWNRRSDESVTVLEGHQSYIVDLVFSPSGRWMISGDNDGVALVWNPKDWLQAPRQLYQGGEDVRAVFHPQEERVATVSSNGYVRIWDVETWQEILSVRLPEQITYPKQILFSPSGDQLFVRTTEWLFLLDAR